MTIIKRNKIKIDGKIIGDGYPALIIAEAGINHNGDIDLAKKMIDAAVEAGVDVIKFQTFFSEEEVVSKAPKAEYQKIKKDDKESYAQMIKKLEITEKGWRTLINYCRQKRIIFLSTPSEGKSARLLEKLQVPAFKMGSGDLVTIPLLEMIATFGKPIILSTGMSTMAEIRQALDCIERKGNNNIVVLHCTTSYPCPLSEVNLRAMQTIQDEFGVLVGYSDHTKGLEASVMAVALGACVIEKHFTLNKNLPGPDHKMSLEPHELKEMVKQIRKIEVMSPSQREVFIKKIKQYLQILGSSEKKLTASESKLRLLCRKSIVARNNLKKGEILTVNKMSFKRPALGLAPKFYKLISERRVIAPILKDEFIKLDDLAKKVVYVTGSRSEYGVMRSLLHKMNQSGFFDLSILPTGMHLSNKFGNTINDIKRDGFRMSDTVDMKIGDGSNSGMAISLGLGVIGLVKRLVTVEPDLVLIAGDRGEALAAAIAAAHLNITVAHISGGDVTTGATVDEKMRHAITQLSDIHFPANQESAKKVISMIGNKRQVFPVGNPGIFANDIISERRKKYIARVFHLNLRNPFLIVIQHPVTTQSIEAESQMSETMFAIEKIKIPAIVIYPNSDAGSDGIIKAINKCKDSKIIQIFRHIERDDFLDLLSLGSALVGNSSAALIEAPSFRIPAVNIGIRQEGRLRGNNIMDANHNSGEIIKAIKMVLSKDFQKNLDGVNPYVQPGTEEKIIDILRHSDSYRINKLVKNG